MRARRWIRGELMVVSLVVLLGAASCSGGKKSPGPAPLCPVASTCAMRHFCNASQSCRCLMSAEGEVRCGQPPSCGIKQCTKSTDCADLGAGYFCDSPGSGCCGDDKQRCIPPCVGETCPESRICGGKCCLEGEKCIAGRCSSGDGGVADGPRDAPPTPADRPVLAVDAPLRPDAPAAVDAPVASGGRDGGSAGAGGSAGTGGTGGAVALGPAWTATSAATKAFVSQLARAWRGEPADLDGDGVAEVTSVLRPDGTRRWESDPKHTGSPQWFVEKNDGTGKATIGLDTLPAPGFEVIELFDRSARTRIETRDLDGSGQPELRRTMRYAVDLQTVEIVHEADPMETGTFAELDRSTEPAAWDQGGTACDGTSNIPGNAISQWWANKAPDMVPGAPGIEFYSGNGAPYDCTSDEATKLAAAFDCALTRARECLPNANQRLAEKMTADAVASQGALHVGCNNPCAGKLATTVGSTMNVGNSVINSLNVNDLCSVIMHEMFHRAGEPGGKDHDSTGTDSTYSCARYCANCSHTGKGAPPSSNVDCARCGETDAEKRRCGVERMLTGVSCPKLDLCHGGLGVNLNCSACKGIQEIDCDGKPFSKEPLFYCCDTCPDSAPRNTDKPCMGAPSLTAGTCGNKPPECPP